MILTIFRIAASLVGLLAFYLSWSLREDQEGKAQHRIEALWVAISDRQKLTGSKTTALFNKVAAVVTSTFDRIFGQKLISVQMIGVSSSYSFAALFLIVGSAVGILLHLVRSSSNLVTLTKPLSPDVLVGVSVAVTFLLVVGLVCFVLATLPALFRSHWSQILSLAPIALFILGVFQLLRRHLPVRAQLGDLGPTQKQLHRLGEIV